MKIRYTLPALTDLDSILTYISATSPRGAARVQKRIQDVVGLLLAHPEIGLRTDDPDIRRLTTTPYPFSRFLRDSEPGDHHPRHPPWCSRSRQDARHARL
ncbi:type II toxin-antitoxin system RelE/ParE family toxin [Bradyrhizobium sp. LB12.1]|uniref:type II toxin-antitoxin system RelE/ParE family toxin n=1 Tax=unclassified Bradyrhizobium TaxID=2631580 RepID=UPI003396FEEA